ncbi:MAG: four helix bundle protein [Phycisphaera sp.]|nr:four helix bundle protein [Phycisphaera sp.]
MENQQQADELQNRLEEFAARIIKLADHLPDSNAGRHIASQILRSGTSPAPNYGEARGAESRADFKHKLGIVQKELNETVIWMRVISRTNLVKASKLDDLLDEATQLARIITASVKTVRTNRRVSAMENGKRPMENGK